MPVNVAINGFGRIGRMVFRNVINHPTLNVVAINASYPADTLAHLIKYDSVHGQFDGTVEKGNDGLVVNGKEIKIVSNRDPRELPWKELVVDLVIEATGKFKTGETAGQHLEAGARKVVITAPGKDVDTTIVMGVNHETYDAEKHHVVSNASCTTNCLAPVAKVLDDSFGIVSGMMTTVHAYTNDQKNIDNPHKDLRRARACGESIIPTSTGAAKAISQVLPQLEGKLSGMALRVPTPNVSLVDLVVELKRDVTVESINHAFETAAQGTYDGVLGFTDEPLVSIDFNTDDRSAIIDGLSTDVMDGNKVKVLAWYDNEWGYSNRVIDLAAMIAESIEASKTARISHRS